MADRQTRRRFLLGAASATATTALAGCTSEGADAPAGNGGDATATAGETTREAATTVRETTTGQNPETATDEQDATASGSASFCQPMTGSPTPYDVAGTPYVFAFDYVDSWTVEDPLDRTGARIQRIVSPALTSEGATSSATVRVGQSFEPVTASEAEAEVEAAIDREDSSGVAYEDEFGGEAVRFVAFPNVDVNSYTAYLPYGDGEKRYYAFSLVTFLDIENYEATNVAQCTDAVNVATQTVRGSLVVNPETTIDQV
ncbi:twin-arginine translocation signal domain-containing protein [Haloarchaeobius amylolyticus]|uniref:twin-arginine translocation signal domain-containing protein n=1 Tax=Haloarchaeobius amylolyticus TaxID=1198296 RepID=UPI0022718F95|nr:twin-arginine translocation signal domain-containing protein [Haloarchaeobius amylolyticus]